MCVFYIADLFYARQLKPSTFRGLLETFPEN